MQEVSRDEFSLLNGASGSSGEKDMCVSVTEPQNAHCRTPSPLDGLPQPPSASPALEIGGNSDCKSESVASGSAAVDLFPTHATTWQQHPMNSVEHAHHRLQPPRRRFNRPLLQGSDDPLMCHGAANDDDDDDDHPVELRTLIAAGASERQHVAPVVTLTPPPAPTKRQQNGCSSLTKQQLKMKAGLMSAQNQATTLPQKASATSATPLTSSANIAKPRTPKPKKKNGVLKLRFHHQALPPEYLSHYEATQAQLTARHAAAAAAAASVQQPPKTREHALHAPKLGQTAKLPPPKSSHENVRSWLQKIAEIQRSAEQQQQQQQLHPPSSAPPPLLCAAPAQHDANNNRPAGKIQAPTPPPPMLYDPLVKAQPPPLLPAPTRRVVQYADLPYMGEITLDNSKPRRGRKPKKADICHLIYKNYGTIFPGTPQHALGARTASKGHAHVATVRMAETEPLNLCLRDCQTTDLCSVSSDAEDEEEARSCASRSSSASAPVITTPSDRITDTLLAANLQTSLPALASSGVAPPPSLPLLPQLKTEPLPPLSLYYQQLLESGSVFGLPISTIEKDNQIALKIPIPSGLFLTTPKAEKVSPIDYPEPLSTPSSTKSEHSTGTTPTVLSANASLFLPQSTPQKRKRSAIFIPPMPAESTTNAATEVSICKFKFTGGAKPSLQEKKMLSVDADGNYRYYSGSGDKSMRYEFYPRDTLHQAGGVLPSVNSVSTFLSAAGEKHSIIDVPPPSADLSNELLQLPESPTSTLLMASISPSSPHAPLSPYGVAAPPSLTSVKASPPPPPTATASTNAVTTTSHIRPIERKKKSRRSSQREKLEKTFKEKGFLIQTQQLESAEGATYCKFRQLKKFTRYLFRNWKDYLPNDLQQAKAAAAAAAAMSTGASTATTESTALESILASHGFASHSFGGTAELGVRQSGQPPQQQQSVIKEMPVMDRGEWESAKV